MASAMPQGAYEAAQAGVEIRRRFFSFKEDIERGLGVPAIWYAEGALMVHPKLLEELRKQPDAEVLEIALTHCFVTKDALREWNEAWPSVVALYRGKDNSEPVLAEKSGLLAKHVVNNLDAAELGAAIVAHMEERELPDEHDHVVRVEEAAVWYRVLDELAFRLLQGQRDKFMDFVEDDLATNLALVGSPPDLIGETMVARSKEYGQYREWVPAKDASARSTLLWEAAKHVGKPIGLEKNFLFLTQFGNQFLRKLNRALVRELLS